MKKWGEGDAPGSASAIPEEGPASVIQQSKKDGDTKKAMEEMEAKLKDFKGAQKEKQMKVVGRMLEENNRMEFEARHGPSPWSQAPAPLLHQVPRVIAAVVTERGQPPL